MMEVGMGVRVRRRRAASRAVRVRMGVRVRVRAAPGVILLPGSGGRGVHVRHPVALFAPHSDHRSLLNDASLRHLPHLSRTDFSFLHFGYVFFSSFSFHTIYICIYIYVRVSSLFFRAVS